ncbi:MAG: GNAT family protein [Solirubrobacterales bacterium]
MGEGIELEKVTLQGFGVRLEPLEEQDHFDGIAKAIRDGELWKLDVTTVPHPDELGPYFEEARQRFDLGRDLPFATIDVASGEVVGSTRFRQIEAAHRRVEIGATFIGASAQRTHVNSAAKLLMMRHAFDTWQVNRVEYLTDVLNDRSRLAIKRIGARPEGILRNHMQMPDGRIRNSAIYSVTSEEWPGVNERLEERLSS